MSNPKNPFTVQTPEDIPAPEVLALFEDVFSDFPNVLDTGHVFLNGPRGSGKSMILRYLQPDCQLLKRDTDDLGKLDFFGIYAPLKNCDLKLTEFQRLEGQHASVILNEHFMTMYITVKAMLCMAQVTKSICSKEDIAATKIYYKDVFLSRLRRCGHTETPTNLDSCNSAEECFLHMAQEAEELFSQVIAYLRHIPFTEEIKPFHGPLCGYLDFLYPALQGLANLPFMPGPNRPIYLLIDDADNLNLTQTKILNSWVSSRTSHIVSIKISTQMNYRTYHTVTGQTIDTPHDYSKLNISTIYTGSRAIYRKRVHAIVKKRLDYFGIGNIEPEQFFLKDTDQEDAIDQIYDQLKKNWVTSGRGNRPEDDALRYARPDYMKSLAGQSKSSSTYSYAGFGQLVHISSGIIRYFLEAAAEMFGDVSADTPSGTISAIPPRIQNSVVRKQADEFLFDDLDKFRDDQAAISPDEKRVTNLYNLIRALGGVFRQILLSNRSERRVFSVAIADRCPTELVEALRLGTRYGYFHESAIGNKEGTGRTRLYILSRRLAPHFNLDPTSFAGYFFLKSSQLMDAMQDPDRFLRTMEKRITCSSSDPDALEERQLKLFN